MFKRYKVLSKRELEARFTVFVEQYSVKLNIEAETAASIARTLLLPAAVRHLAQLREAGVSYSVVKNTLARKAAAGTPLEQAADHFKGVTAIALSPGDPVGLAKAITKFTKANPDVFKFKVGLVEGRVVELKDVEAIASLPSREELISKVLFLINAQAQRLATVLQAVPRNLAVVVGQVRDAKTA